MVEDLKIIKKKFGDNMSKFCSENFSDIIERNPGLLSRIILDNFDSSLFLYDDIVSYHLESSFKKYVYSLIEKDKVDANSASPAILLKRIGYTLYQCHNEAEVQYFKRFYASDEELATFKGDRLKSCHVFFAVKDNVDSIKRDNFKEPARQDEYGTSVLSIQFTKDENQVLSIKNRYNHVVDKSDETFNNNLDSIIPGLTNSFANTYGLGKKLVFSNFDIPYYVKGNDGKNYKYYYEQNDIFYCVNNIIIDHGEVKKFPKEKEIIADYYIIHIEKGNNKIYLYDSSIEEKLISSIGEVKLIKVINENQVKKITITSKNGVCSLYVNSFGRIINVESQLANQDIKGVEAVR